MTTSGGGELSYPARSVRRVRSSFDVAVRREFAIRTVTCDDDHKRWSGVEIRHGHGVVLVQRGRFRRHGSAGVTDLDRTVGYVSHPGEEERFAHPAGGDRCTSVSLSQRLWRAACGDTSGGAHAAVYVDARLDLAHRRLLAAARAGDVDYAVTEGLLDLVGTALRHRVVHTGAGGGADRALAAAAREAVVAGHPASGTLLSLADLLGASPFRLSRAFSRHVGVSLTRFRNRVRVGLALDRLEAGEPSLGVLAADLGFADQAHLCRTVRAHLGYPPVALRRLLAEAAPTGATGRPG
jgi:AraC-like DNA-binding protein